MSTNRITVGSRTRIFCEELHDGSSEPSRTRNSSQVRVEASRMDLRGKRPHPPASGGQKDPQDLHHHARLWEAPLSSDRRGGKKTLSKSRRNLLPDLRQIL